jgi:hypothetical protein
VAPKRSITNEQAIAAYWVTGDCTRAGEMLGVSKGVVSARLREANFPTTRSDRKKQPGICSKCGRHLPLADFGENEASPDGRDWWCKSCKKTYKAAWKQENRERELAKARAYAVASRSAAPEHHRELRLSRVKRLRATALRAYGGDPPKCACCGEAHEEFLQIDHPNGDGAEHRRQIRVPIYSWLKQNGYPPGFRVLCANCNWSHGRWHYCPHEILE